LLKDNNCVIEESGSSRSPGLVRRPSGLPSIADIVLHRHELPQRANSRL
jgi:hypothetical protein